MTTSPTSISSDSGRPYSTVGVVGLGYIGLPVVAVLADRGFDVIGVDIDAGKIDRLKSHYTSGIFEPGLDELLLLHSGRIRYTADYAEMMREADAIIISVGTELQSDGTPDFRTLDSCRQSLAPHLRAGQLLIFKSTVPPGTTRRIAMELQDESGLSAGDDFFIAYSPERTVEGAAISELQSLTKIVGGLDETSRARAIEIFERVGGSIVPVSSLEVAEMCKLVDNTFRAMNIAFANEIGELCEKVGIDSYELSKAVSEQYPRTNLLRSGLGAGGPCLSKDPGILQYAAESRGSFMPIVAASIGINLESTRRAGKIAREFFQRQSISDPVVAFLGLAFKGNPPTDDIRLAPSVVLHEYLTETMPGIRFEYYDPNVTEFQGQAVHLGLSETVRVADVILILTDHPSLQNLSAANFLNGRVEQPILIVDCWHGIKDPEKITESGWTIVRLGDGRSHAATKTA